MAEHNELGDLAEKIASSYLENKNYEIVALNKKDKLSEIDIIALEKNELVFVEVRARKTEKYGGPEESVDNRKLKKIVFNAHKYMSEENYQGLARIDVVCLVFNDFEEVERFSHYENVYWGDQD